jgi:hypothetical protein
MVFRQEYMVPVAEQTIGKDDAGSGVLRIIPRMPGISDSSAGPSAPGNAPLSED